MVVQSDTVRAFRISGHFRHFFLGGGRQLEAIVLIRIRNCEANEAVCYLRGLYIAAAAADAAAAAADINIC